MFFHVWGISLDFFFSSVLFRCQKYFKKVWYNEESKDFNGLEPSPEHVDHLKKIGPIVFESIYLECTSIRFYTYIDDDHRCQMLCKDSTNHTNFKQIKIV